MRRVTQNRMEYKHKGNIGRVLKEKWKNKVMHGQYIRNIDSLFVKKTPSSGYRREK